MKLETADPALWNEDLAPVAAADRTWDWKAFAALWVGMVVCIPTYTLAGGLISSGLSAMQAVGVVLLGNLIVLVPMLLTGHAGAKHGLPFPVLLRSSFGPRGAQIPALARALVACGWFGINTWIGGSAVYVALNILSHDALKGSVIPFLGIDLGQFACFMVFWAVHLVFISKGIHAIKGLEKWSAPFLIVMGLLLLGWAYLKADGFGPMMAKPSDFGAGGPKQGQLLPTLATGLTAMVGFWATMALNICDFTRFARTQKDQVVGQSIGLPVPMALFAFIGVAVTSATVVIYGEPIWNPVDLAAKLGGVGSVVALLAVMVATLNVNLAANLVSPAYDISNLAPSKISFKTGGYITALIGVAIMPWKLMQTAATYISTWLVGYSALLGPIAGVLIADYFIRRKTELDVPSLFQMGGRYYGKGGFNLAGVIAVIIGVAPNLPGFLHTVGLASNVPAIFDTLFTGAWFVGFFLAGGAYLLLAAMAPKEA